MGKNKSGNTARFWESDSGWKAVEVGDDVLLGAEEYGFAGLEELDPSCLGNKFISAIYTCFLPVGDAVLRFFQHGVLISIKYCCTPTCNTQAVYWALMATSDLNKPQTLD